MKTGKGNWTPIDKRLVFLLPTDREFTYLEAMFSYSVDRDNKRRGSINGYAALWKWSRDKVRRFIRTIEIGADYLTDGHKTGKRQAIRYVFNTLRDAENRDADPHTDPHTDPTKNLIDPLASNPKKPSKENKGAPTDKRPAAPLSFENYLKRTDTENKKEEAQTIAYYLGTYEKQRGEPHPYLKPDQWDRVINTIFVAEDPDFGSSGRDLFVDYEIMKEVINKHFQTKYENCDYNILHFISGKIIYLRACECGY